jgi:uncharacterized protein involved in exopolysaccharide biosynthesis
VAPSTPAPSTTDPAEKFDFFGYALIGHHLAFALRAPLRHKALAVVAFLLVVGAAGLAMWGLPIRWRVQSTILAQRNPIIGSLSNPGMNREWDMPARAAREAIIRRENLAVLVKQTNFASRYLESRAPAIRARDWVVENALGRERETDELIDILTDTLEDRLWVTATHEGAVTIAFEWSDPEIAHAIVEAATQTFLEERHATEIRAVSETIAVLVGHDARVQQEIAGTIVQVEEKERALRIRTGPRRVPVVRQRVAQDEELVRIESTLTARRRALTDLEEFRERRLAELRADLGQQQGIYAPQHPTIASTRQAIDSLSAPSPQIAVLRTEIQDLEREVRRRGGSLSPGDAIAASASAALDAELAEARLRLESDDPRLEFERRQLQLLLRQHANLLDRIDSARVEMDTAQAAFKYRYSVITPPQIPKRPVRPYGLIIMLAGLVGGVGFAFFATAALDLWHGRLVERWQVEAGMDLPVVAEISR